MNKHTPGPWIHTEDDDNYHAVTAGCGYHVNSDDDGFEIAGCISKANAMLIAAAPDLLEALEELKCELILSDVDMDYIESHFRKALNKAHVAIARARGES